MYQTKTTHQLDKFIC